MDRVAVVTGGNRGLGLETCKQLAGKGFTVVLTSRDPGEGKRAAEKLGAEYHQCDVTNEKSIADLAQHLKKTYGQVDVLVNNAGIYIDTGRLLEEDFGIVEKSMEVNAYGPLRMTRALAPLMMPGARIINISSGRGQLPSMEGDDPAYSVSKTALNAVTRVLAGELRGKVAVNSVCPGWVRTRMGRPEAERSVEEGVQTTVWLATMENPPTGKFFRDKKEIPW